MAEGVFPKTDGEIYYSSELNKLNYVWLDITAEDGSTTKGTSFDYGAFAVGTNFLVDLDTTIVQKGIILSDNFTGGELKFTLYYANGNNSSGLAKWQISYLIKNNDEGLTSSTGNTGTDLEHTSPSATDQTLNITGSHTTSGVTVSAGDLLIISLYRNGAAVADTAGNLKAMAVKVEVA